MEKNEARRLIKRLNHLDKPEHAGIRAVVQKEIDALAPKKTWRDENQKGQKQ